jgi:hypothetical protein
MMAQFISSCTWTLTWKLYLNLHIIANKQVVTNTSYDKKNLSRPKFWKKVEVCMEERNNNNNNNNDVMERSHHFGNWNFIVWKHYRSQQRKILLHDFLCEWCDFLRTIFVLILSILLHVFVWMVRWISWRFSLNDVCSNFNATVSSLYSERFQCKSVSEMFCSKSVSVCSNSFCSKNLVILLKSGPLLLTYPPNKDQ